MSLSTDRSVPLRRSFAKKVVKAFAILRRRVRAGVTSRLVRSGMPRRGFVRRGQRRSIVALSTSLLGAVERSRINASTLRYSRATVSTEALGGAAANRQPVRDLTLGLLRGYVSCAWK